MGPRVIRLTRVKILPEVEPPPSQLGLGAASLWICDVFLLRKRGQERMHSDRLDVCL